MLDQDRYTWRHNSVLRIIMDTLKDVSDQSWSFYCDLAGAKKIESATIPPDILPTQQRPDLVLINDSSKSIIIIELTVPFEQNIHKAQERKLNKCAGLTSDLQEQGYDTKLLCVEVGSKWLIADSNQGQSNNACSFQSIFPWFLTTENLWSRSQKKILKSLSQRAIVCSYAIFYSKYDQDWST